MTVPPYKRHVNTVFQSYALFEHLSWSTTWPSASSARRCAKAEILTRRGRRLVELHGRERRRPRELSGGQSSGWRSPARCQPPSVLLLDEPLGALDGKLRKQMQVELKGIQREVGITFLYVTHDQEEALAMSDRIAVMEDGEVQQCSSPEDVYEHPSGLSWPASSGCRTFLRPPPRPTVACGRAAASTARRTPPECAEGT